MMPRVPVRASVQLLYVLSSLHNAMRLENDTESTVLDDDEFSTLRLPIPEAPASLPEPSDDDGWSDARLLARELSVSRRLSAASLLEAEDAFLRPGSTPNKLPELPDPWNKKMIMTNYISGGAGGSVYSAKIICGGKEESGQKVAVKINTNAHGVPDQEFKLLMHLDNPNIIKCFGYGLIDRKNPDGDAIGIFEIMETDYDDEIALSKKLTEQDKAKFATDLLSALAYAHEQGLLHRDIKGANILSKGDDYKIGDFGCACCLTCNFSSKCAGYFGSPLYSSPANVNSGVIGRTQDLWAMGVMLHMLILGLYPAPINLELQRKNRRYPRYITKRNFVGHIYEIPKKNGRAKDHPKHQLLYWLLCDTKCERYPEAEDGIFTAGHAHELAKAWLLKASGVEWEERPRVHDVNCLKSGNEHIELRYGAALLGIVIFMAGLNVR
eukprot:TRINITY_DN29110_c0_g2_i1.p1 TRINITY_DN29110_c0_g2~~TRINITY_DN29110_c0_g2_i1.p1  ORF type:complete len:458 (-),score=42.10 TRINITY_DN29110_c0_g2_i1:39-1355(-)